MDAPGTAKEACPHVVDREQLLVTQQEAEHANQRCEKNRGYLGSINKQFVVVVTGAVLITVR